MAAMATKVGADSRVVAPLELVDFGLGPYLNQAPSPRFPVYTRGNAGEVYPEVVFPLSMTMFTEMGTEAGREAALRSGLITSKEVDELTAGGGIFGGYMYLNLSLARVIAVRTPGASVAEIDATYLGSEDVAPPHVSHPSDRNLWATLRGIRYGLRLIGARSLPVLDDQRDAVEVWRQALPDRATATDDELVAVLDGAVPHLVAIYAEHLAISGAAGLGVNLLRRSCEALLGDGSVALELLSGIGGVSSAEPSYALWDLGRMVAADPALGAAFDAGLDGLADRLAVDPAAELFWVAFEEFLERHGCRGPNEWEMACEVWGTDLSLPLTLVDRMRQADDDHDPRKRAAQLLDRRRELLADVRGRLRGGKSRRLERDLRCAVLYTRGREEAKTLLVEIIHDCRLAARELGRRLAERSGGRPDDLWFVTAEELDDFRDDPAAFTDLVASRRATRDALAELEPPFTFSGEVPPVSTWARRSDVQGSDIAVGTVLSGIPGCSGIARGRARVVTDPSDPGDLGPGDVLVAPLTDPAWTPLFVPAEAVVVDVGGQLSHAVIVSRELGLPCVVSATGASRTIPDGSLIEVDGTAGTVTIVAMPGG